MTANIWQKIRASWAKRSVKIVVAVIAVLVLVIIAQLVWPRDVALPLRWIDDIPVGFKNTDEIKRTLNNDYNNQQLNIINHDDHLITKPISDLDITIDFQNQVDEVLDYPLWQRFIPFSSVLSMIIQPTTSPPSIKVSSLAGFSCSDPTDARIAVEDGALSVQPAENGCSFNPDALLLALSKLGLRGGNDTILYFDIQINPANITTETADGLVTKILQNTTDGIDFVANELTLHATTAEIIDVLEFTNDSENHTIDVSANLDKLHTLIDKSEMANRLFTAQDTIIYISNGIETGAVIGRPGLGADYDKIAADLVDVATNKTQLITIELTDVTPRVIYKRSYSADWIGLVTQLTDQYAGKAYAIAVLDLAGGRQDMFINADRQFTAASTYKLFTAYSMFKSDNPPLCLDMMIVYSDNNCPESFLAGYGYGQSTNDARSVGTNSTSFSPGNMVTTARDLSTFLRQIYNGSILSPTDNSRLLNDMKTQVYRNGIPAGIGNSGVVADKVGFLWGLLHDAAIIYTNRGDYIIVIMTDGYSWRSIADTTHMINERM